MEALNDSLISSTNSDILNGSSKDSDNLNGSSEEIFSSLIVKNVAMFTDLIMNWTLTMDK